MTTGERIVIHEADLPDLRQVGGRLRAACPIHGSDHQRSLSIQPEGQYAGFGKCFSCGAEVLVEEMNPDAAQRLGLKGALTAEKLLRPVHRYEAEQTDWQKRELEALQALDAKMRSALLQSERARAYLAERAIPLEIAEAVGVGFLPPNWKDQPALRPLQKWVNRLTFPLSSPMGRGYSGRALDGWQSGMDENEHKRLLEQDGMPRRWEKTYPAGWFGLADLAPDADKVILVEGPFDRLALLAAGIDPSYVIALVGSKDSRVAEWIPPQIQRVILSLDGDKGGIDSALALGKQLYTAGLQMTMCLPYAEDEQGKDWSERLRHMGTEAIAPVIAAFKGQPTSATNVAAPPDTPAESHAEAENHAPASKEAKAEPAAPVDLSLPVRARLLLECLPARARGWNLCRDAARIYVAINEPPYMIDFWGRGADPHYGMPLWQLIGQTIEVGGKPLGAALDLLERIRGVRSSGLYRKGRAQPESADAEDDEIDLAELERDIEAMQDEILASIGADDPAS